MSTQPIRRAGGGLEHEVEEVEADLAELEGERRSMPLTGIVVSVLGALVLVGAIFAIEPLREAILAALRGDSHGVQREVDSLGWAGPLVVIALALAHAVVFYPAEILDAAAGYLYGFWIALPLVMAGWVISAWIGYWIGRGAGRPLLHRLAGAERFEKAEAMIERGGVMLLLAVRLIPIVPFSIACYACGAARVPLWRFTWTTAVGYLPITALSVLLGSRLHELSLGDPLLWAAIAGFALLLFAAHRLIPRQRREKDGEAAEAEDKVSA